MLTTMMQKSLLLVNDFKAVDPNISTRSASPHYPTGPSTDTFMTAGIDHGLAEL